MKHTLPLLAFLILLFTAHSCKKAENKVYFEGGTAPSLKASTSVVSLEQGDEANTAIVLSWTNPDYKFTTGLSSQDVSYSLEMDTAGANFGSSIKQTIVIANDLSKVFTVGELNPILGNEMLLQLNPRRDYTLEVRVTSSLGSTAKLTSNVISFTTRPFAPAPKIEPPTNGTLWATGNAFASDWSNPLPTPYDVSQQFTQLSNTLYELTVPMIGGGAYKLIQEQGVWGTQYHMLAGGTWEGGNFEKKDAEPGFPGPPTAGNYKITVDFQLGKFNVVKQ